MITAENLFLYLEKKIPDFVKTRKAKTGELLFCCPNIANHHFKSAPSATFTPSGNIACLVCGFKGSTYDCIRTIEPEFKNKTDAEISIYLNDFLGLGNFAELDAYQKYGFALIPLLQNSKVAFEKGWTTTEHRDKVRWVKWLNNGLNIGIRTGEVSKITVIDVDLKVAPTGQVEEIYKQLIALGTLMQDTPHGKHFVVQYDKELKQTANVGGLHIDIRNDNGQIVAAPSIINGISYKWVNLGVEIKTLTPELKSKLLELIKKGNNNSIETPQEQIQTELPKLKNNDLEGCCNNTFVSIGGMLIKQLTPEQTEFVLNIMNKHLLKDPMPSSSIRGMVKSLTEYKGRDEETYEKIIYDYMKLMQTDVTPRDIMDNTRLPRAIVDKYLSKFVKEGKAIRLGRGRYQYREKIEWSDAVPETITEYEYKVPLFNDVAIFQNGDCLILGARTNEGKCISNGYLSTNKGLINIEDIGKIRPEGISEDKGNHIRLFTGKLQDKAYRRPNYFWKEKVTETIKITTEYGYELEGTPNHKIIVLSKKFNNGQYKTEFKALKDIKENEEVLIVSPQHFAKQVRKNNRDFRIKQSKHTTNIKTLSQPLKEIIPDLARLIGYIIGDGSLSENSINIYVNNVTEKNTIAQDIETILKNYGLKPKYKITNNCLKITIHSTILLKWFKRRVLKLSSKVKNIKSSDRYIPLCILQGNKEIQINFINALFSCESSLNNGTAIEITMASKKVIDALHIMLLNFGIFARKQEKSVKKYTNNKYWKITISSEMGYKFFNIFDPIKYKNNILPAKIKRKSRIKTFGNNQFYKDVYFVDKIKTKLYLAEEKYVYDFNIESKRYNTNNQFWCNGFVNHNTTIALNMLREMIEQGVKPFYVFSEAGCFDDQTEILTNNGWKKWDTINYKDKVLSLNPVANFATYKDISNIFIYDYDGELLTYNSEALNFKLTPNHKIYYRSAYKDFYELNEINEVNKYIKYYKFKTNFNIRDKHYRCKDIKIGNRKIPKNVILEFLGWFVSEGCLMGLATNKKAGYGIQITQRKKEYQTEIADLLTRLDVKFHFYNNEMFIFYDKDLWWWLRRQCYRKDLEKQRRSYIKLIPQIVKESSPEEVEYFLNAYTKGDGSFMKSGKNIRRDMFTTQKHLADDLQILILKTGKSARVRTAKTKQGFDYYIVREIFDNEVDVKTKFLRKENYKGKIWCVETKPYHLIFVRRQGCCFWSGNSRFQKISQILGIAGKYYHTFHENPLSIELEYNAFTVIDWLHLENKAETDNVLKKLNDELQRKGGILVIFTQLKQNLEFFAPNLIDHYPTFAARLIQDNESKTESHFDISKIKEPRGNYTTYILPCEYNPETKIFRKKEVI